MALQDLTLKVLLENIHCHDEGDGWGDAEPYLWPVFFKIDGDSFAVTSAGLIGFPLIESRNGNHRNLGHLSVDEGDNVSIPEELGSWQNTFKPIPVLDDSYKLLLGDNISGITGIAVVLMEEDGWPDELAVAGYNTFVNAVQLSVAKVAAGFQRATHEPTKEEIQAAIATVKATASSMVCDGVKGAMSGWELVWFGTFGNNDDTIGSEVWTVSHDDFEKDAFIEFNGRWSGDESGDGDWEFPGHSQASLHVPPKPCRGSLAATSAVLGQTRLVQCALSEPTCIQPFRGWNCGGAHLSSGTPDVVRIASRNPPVREAVGRLFVSLPDVLAAPDRPLTAEHMRDLTTVLEAVSNSTSFLPRTVAKRGLTVLPELEGRSWNAAIRRVSRVRPRGRKRC